ncbi:MAG: diaminopimelate epimerase [Clostridia bacterium]|nr:diaminopimelate epimerase [Clostridia bacterium]
MKFTKMQGLGNDYLYFWGEPQDPAALSVRLSDRHFGPGADGIITISPSEHADFRMRIFNADGSEARMCGNGIRCVGKYVYDKGYTDKTELRIETLSGVRTLKLETRGGRVRRASVDMGCVSVSEDRILELGGTVCTVTPVNVGNPHAVCFVPDAEALPLAEIGPKVEKHPAFPGGVNAEFVQILMPDTLRMRVWERGSGITMACGTGACASAAAAVKKGFCRAGETIRVTLDGGTLDILVRPDYSVTMTGPAEFVYEGEIDG